MKIKQEIIKTGVPQPNNPTRIKVNKYHISGNFGNRIARKNKWFDYYKKLPQSEHITIFKEDIEVERIIDGEK